VPRLAVVRSLLLALSFALCFTSACSGGCESERGAEPPATPSEAAIDRGLAFLVAHQSDDGAFRSTTYAAFRDGRATTPLVAMALWIRADDPRFETSYRRAVDWIASQPSEVHAYPVYSAAASLLVLSMPRNERHRDRIGALRHALAAEQRSDGGFGYLNEASNLSTTLFAIGALRLAGHDDESSFTRARAFVESCQNFGEGPLDDGGFFFSPGFADGNKAGPAGADDRGPRFHSYGSMTADGLRALVRLGAPPDHPRVIAASSWLRAHFVPDHNPGEFEPLSESRRDGSYFYYAWSVAHAFNSVGERAFAEPLSRELVARQAMDGAWRNSFTEMHEDDPLVATAFAVASLAIAGGVSSGHPRAHASDR
jgi:hypothetical protein